MTASFDFKGKVALITGSSSGIGASIAILFAKSGAQVVITGRNEEKMQSVVKQCSDVSPNRSKALEVVADVTKDEDLDRLVKTTIDTLGKLDILVNNAGAGVWTDINDSDYIEKYRKTMNTNLNSVVYLTHICVKYLEKTKGNVINISSVVSLTTVKSGSPYCMSKSALDMFTKCMALDLGSKGIRVNSINPGLIKSDFLTNLGMSIEEESKFYEEFSSKYLVGRVGDAIDVANSTLFVASDQASFITGTNIVVDGGHIAGNISFTKP